MHPTCETCARPADGTAYACRPCADRAREQLHAIADVAPAARDVAHGQTRRGPAVAGGAGERLPVNLAATARLDAVTNAVTTWARHATHHRGDTLPAGGDPLEVAARYLAGKLDWLRFRQEAAEALTDIAAAHRVITGLVDGPADRRYLGPCRGTTDDGDCEADVYARMGADHATCRACGARHEVAARRAWLDGEARQHSYTAAEISAAYGIRANTIRVWHHRGRIQPAGEIDGRPLFPLGEVLDLAAEDAARRATEQSRRARRRAEQEKRPTDDAA